MLVQLNKGVLCVVLMCKGGIVVMVVCLRQFCLNMRVVVDISGFAICLARCSIPPIIFGLTACPRRIYIVCLYCNASG